MSPVTLWRLYRARLRVHLAQELLAGAGIAIAVALVFATLVASGSIAGSAADAIHTVVGPAELQLRTRGPDGFPQSVLKKVEHLPGVSRAAPLLEQNAVLQAGSRTATVDLTGTDLSLATLDGLIHHLPLSVVTREGVGLSRASADALGIHGGSRHVVTVKLRGSRRRLAISAVLGHEEFGGLAHALVAVMPLERLQALAGLHGRISRVLVLPRAGRTQEVRARLRQIAGGRLTVAAADQDVQLLKEALRPSGQASDLFAAISALLGFLFAFNAMLLTAPERREAIADLRVDGARRSAIAQMVLIQGALLGIAASVIGVLVGYLLSSAVFASTPGYLTQAFTLGTGTVIGALPLAVALAGGVLTTCLASAVPLLDLRSGRPVDAVYSDEGAAGNALEPTTQLRLAGAAIALLIAATLLYALASETALVACLLLALASVLAIPVALGVVIRGASGLAARFGGLTSLPVAISALRSTTLRSLALAATGAVALFGSVALGGARQDLLRGIDGYTAHYTSAAAVWALTPQDNQATNDFPQPEQRAAVEHAPGVGTVEGFYGSFLDAAGRRLWVIGWPTGVPTTLLREQVIEGDAHTAEAEIRRGGWAAVSKQVAAERGLAIGSTLRLPTPTGTLALRVAATTTNFGWSPGAVVMNASEYRRAWATTAPSALGIQIRPSADAASVSAGVREALGRDSGLEVLTASSRAHAIETSASEGLGQLSEISLLLVVAAILAMLAALAAGIWQRRASLAGLRMEGARPRRLRTILTIEAVMLLGSGAIVGTLAGIYGQAVIDSYLKSVTGFPVASFAATTRPLELLAVVLAVVLAISMIPTWRASRVAPTLALGD